MAIDPTAPLLPEMDIALLSGTGEFVPNSPGYPEIDITLLPGVPGVSATYIKETAVLATSYHHIQNSASSTWTINHNLHFLPNVTVFDSGGTQVEGNIVHTNVNSLTISFSAAIAGNAILS